MVVLAVSAVVLSVAAQEATDQLVADDSALDLALRYGVTPVLVVLLLLTRKLWTDGAYQAQVQRAERAEARADRQEGKVDAMVDLFRTEVTPALVSSRDVVTESQRLIGKLADRLQQ